MTLGILAPPSTFAQDAPWGWWDDADSIARPVPDEEFLGGARGRARLSAASGPAGGPTDRRWDAIATMGALKVDAAGRCDSQCVGVRQRVSWSGRRLRVQVGDLSSRSEEPLLEDAGAVSNRPSPLSVLGSGRSSAGADVEAGFPDLLPWESTVRSRVFSVRHGGTRGNILGSAGIFRAGAAFGDGDDAAVVPAGGLFLESPAGAIEASHVGAPGEGAWRLALRSRGDALRQEWTIARRDPPKGSGFSGRDEASVRLSWRRDGSRMDWEGLARSDSTSRNEIRAVAAFSQDFAGTTLRLRSRWNGGAGSSSSSLTPGIRRSAGRFRPWAECAWSTAQEPRPSAGLAWIERAWRLESSTTRRKDGTWDWASSSAVSGGATTLEVRVAQRNSELEGGGTWSYGW